MIRQSYYVYADDADVTFVGVYEGTDADDAVRVARQISGRSTGHLVAVLPEGSLALQSSADRNQKWRDVF